MHLNYEVSKIIDAGIFVLFLFHDLIHYLSLIFNAKLIIFNVNSITLF